jgi:ABC-type uncharacterized transport system permease subunit
MYIIEYIKMNIWLVCDIVFTLLGAYLGYHAFKSYDISSLLMGTGLFSVLGFLCGKLIGLCFLPVILVLTRDQASSQKHLEKQVKHEW